MKKILILFFVLPLFSVCQVKHSSNKAKKPSSVKPIQPFDGFIITGAIKGFPDGTDVSFLNEQTGVPEKQAAIQQGIFVIKGKMEQPGLKYLIFGDVQVLVPLFLDNSNVKIKGDKSALDKVVITGSPSHVKYAQYINSIKPFMQDTEYDSTESGMIANISEAFVKKNPASYISALAIIYYYQVTENGVKTEYLYNLLPQPIKASSFGAYVDQKIQESKINPIGSVVTDFSQADTAGTPVKISSFRGKYVLLDFWASWCRPCRMENPNVVAAYNKFKDKNFTVLGVSLDQAKPAWIDAIKMDNLTWSHVSDLKGGGNEVAAQFRVKGIPQNFLLDPEGRIIAKNLRGDVLEKKLEAVLK